MYNPDFWEVGLEPGDLAQYPNEASPWFETLEDRLRRRFKESQTQCLMGPVMEVIADALTAKQREALLLYYLHRKTQEEIAQIMGISRRVVSQHIFGICRNGKQVGGAIKKIQKLFRQQGISLPNSLPN